jgi:hypothetical protein
MNPSKEFRELFVGLTISSAIILSTLPGMDNAYTQSISPTENSTTQQHAEHILDNLVISEHIPLTTRFLPSFVESPAEIVVN